MEKARKSFNKLYARKRIDKGIYERIGKDGNKRYQVVVRLTPHAPQSESFDRLTDARKWQENTKAAIREGKYFKTAEAKKHTLGELVDRYIREVLPKKPKSFRKQSAQLLWWKREIGSCLLSDLAPPLLVEKREKLGQGLTRSKDPRSPSTVNRYLAALSHALTIGTKEWGWLDDSPMRKISKPSEPRGRVRFLSDEERKKLLSACKESINPYLYIAVVLSLAVGLRRSELLNLTWGDVCLQKGRIILQETKNGERRTLPVSGLPLQLLKDLERKRRIDSILLFPGKHPRKPIDLRTAWEKCLRLCAIKQFVWHDLRHCCGSYLTMNGASLTEVSEILGHKTISMAKRYSHLSESHTAGVVANMNEKIFG